MPSFALCSSEGAGLILTDSEAGYGHSIILVNSDDNSDLLSTSMLGRVTMRGVRRGARGGSCSNLFGVALPWKPMNPRESGTHETHALSRLCQQLCNTSLAL